MKDGIRNTTETIALASDSTIYVYIGDITDRNNLNIEFNYAEGTLTSCTLTMVTKGRSGVDFWYKDLANMRLSSDYDLTKPFPPAATPTVGCHETRLVYAYDSSDGTADNGTTVIKPSAIASGDDGRWLSDAGAEYGKYLAYGSLSETFTADAKSIFEAIDFSGGSVLLKVDTVGTASAASILSIDVISK